MVKVLKNPAPIKRLFALLLSLSLVVPNATTAIAAVAEYGASDQVVVSHDTDGIMTNYTVSGPAFIMDTDNGSASSQDDNDMKNAKDPGEVAEGTEVNEAQGEDYIPPGVWSDQEPYFTDEVQPLTSVHRRSAARLTYPTYKEVHDALIGLKDKYPEGMVWTNHTPYGSQATDPDKVRGYKFKGGPVYGADRGSGCAAWVFESQDTPFGSLPAYVTPGVDISNVKPGDFFRINNSHFVIATSVVPNGIIVSEGNYNGTVHYGRSFSMEELKNITTFSVSRYPSNYTEDEKPTIIDSGIEGTLTWTLDNQGLLSIIGNSAIPDYTASVRPSWEKHANEVYTVMIGDGITGIGDYAFYQYGYLIDAYIPSSITTIGDAAFSKSSLVAVSIPSNVEIGKYAFSESTSLNSVTISEGVETIGDYAFSGCTGLKNVDLPSTIRTVGLRAFEGASITSIRFKPSDIAVSIADGAFTKCYYLSDVVLPSNLTEISDSLFQSCSSLLELHIPKSVTNFGMTPFGNTGMQLYGGTIYFEGSSDEWINAGGGIIKSGIPKVEIKYDQVYNNPFIDDGSIDIDFPCSSGHAGEPDADGNCSICGQPMESTPVDPTPIEHQHIWSDEWANDGAYHWHECTADGCVVTENAEKDGYDAHSYAEWVIDAAATATTDGSQHRDCAECGYREIGVISATGETTGDTDNDGGKNDSGNSGDSGASDNSGNSGDTGTSGSDSSGPSGSGSSGSGSGSGSSSGSSGGNSSYYPSYPIYPGGVTNTGNATGDNGPEEDTGKDDAHDSNDTEAPTDSTSTGDSAINNPDVPDASTGTESNDQDEIEKPTTSTRKIVSEMKNQLSKEMRPKMERQIAKRLKTYIKVNRNKMSKSRLKTKAKRHIKPLVKKAIRPSLTASIRKKYKEPLGGEFANEYNLAFNKLFTSQYNKQFAKIFPKIYKK